MDKYKVGDRFIVTLTDIEEMGMGTLYTLDNIIQTDKVGIGRLERIENVSDCHVEQISEPKAREYTLEELQERILVISDLLNQTVTAYREAKGNLKNGIELADAEMERLNG